MDLNVWTRVSVYAYKHLGEKRRGFGLWARAGSS